MRFYGGDDEVRREIASRGSGGSETALLMAAAERPKLLYIIVDDNVAPACPGDGDFGGYGVCREDIEGRGGDDGGGEEGNVASGRSNMDRGPRECPPPRYTRSVLQSTLQLMGCKPRHALKISVRVFDVFGETGSVGKEDGGGCGSDEYEVSGRLRQFGGRRNEDGPAASYPTPFVYWHDFEKILPEEKEQIELDPGEKYFQENHVDAVNDIFSWKSRSECGKPAGKRRASVTVSRDEFLDVICDALAKYQYVGPNQRADLILACRVREKRTSVTVLLCGTSGCGKSTLSSLLASRLGITTVVSTDSIRHMMRSFVSEKENSLLWASTYHAGECLDPAAIAEAKNKSKVAKMPAIPLRSHPPLNGQVAAGAPGLNSSSMPEQEGSRDKDWNSSEEASLAGSEPYGKQPFMSENYTQSNKGAFEAAVGDGSDATVGTKTIVVQGFKAQSEMVMDSLDRLISGWEKKNESVVVEGVHLSLNFVMGLMKKHPSIVPFMVYISNEDKHLERFAVRAKYMTLDPARNKYVKYIRNIRTIQEYLCKRADKHLVPKVNNTNVDKSITVIHATIFSCLRRRMAGEALCDPATNTVKVVDQEYRKQYAASPLGSKGMFQLIQRRGSSRHLMALMNMDGSVAKAWPIEADSNGKQVPESSNGSESGVGTPVYGPLTIGKAEPVNVRFGNFGLSAWPTDTGNASNPVSVSSSAGDGHNSRGEGDLNSSRPESSGSSSPKAPDVGEKELTDEVEVFGSDEEPEEEEPRAIDSNGESSDSGQEHMDDEDGGSVDDQSERSDEEYDPTHPPDDGFWSDNS